MTAHHDTYVASCEAAETTKAKGDALEQLICDAFTQLDGVIVHSRNVKDELGTQEVDVVLWNDKDPGDKGLIFMDQIILVEAKNWADPVGAMHVAWFKEKVEAAGREHGVLVAASGITGEADDRRFAAELVLKYRSGGLQIIVLRPQQLDTDASGLQALMKQRLGDLAVGIVGFDE